MLLGHIRLHGLQQPEQATISYKRVLQRCPLEDNSSGAGTTTASNVAISDLLKDPFLNTDPDQARPAPADVVTAMPWLTSDEEPRSMPTPDPSPTPAPLQAPVPSPETTVTPAANSEVEKQKPEPTAQKHHPGHHRASAPTTGACGQEAFGTLMAAPSTPARHQKHQRLLSLIHI